MATIPGAGGDRPLAALSIEKGPGSGTDLPVIRPTVYIGRSGRNDVVIDDDSVSTRHALLEYDRGTWLLTDLASANGTFLDGDRLPAEAPTPISDGSALRFGAVETRFTPIPGGDPDALKPASAPPATRTRISDRRSGVRVPLWLVLVLLILIAAVWFGLVWTPEPAPAPPADEPAIGLVVGLTATFGTG